MAATKPKPKTKRRSKPTPKNGSGKAKGSAADGAKADPERQAQSAAAPSPFPPIAEYAFLSNCHTGALVAPDGAVDWLCVPRFDSPSVFGTLLDREAGRVPARAVRDQRSDGADLRARDEHRCHDVEDADRLGHRVRRADDGPAAGRGRDHAAHPSPGRRGRATTCSSARCSASRASVEIELVCEPVFDYGRTPAEWTLVDGDRHTADASGAGRDDPAATDMALGIEGDWVRARHALQQGEQLFCSLSWAEDLASPRDVDEANARIAATRRYWRGWLDRARLPDHRWRDPIQRSALAIKGLTYMPTGATVAALTTSLPETPGGERNWDYRFTWMRDSTFTLQALHCLNLDWEADEFMQFVADLEPNEDGALQIMYGIDGRRDLTESHAGRAVRVRGREPGADRQRRLRPAPERRLRRGARLDSAAHPAQRAAAAAPVADRPVAGGVRDRGLAQSRPGDLGGARRAPALRVVQAHVLGRARPRGEAGRDPRRPEAGAEWRATADEIKADILEHGVRDGVLRQHYDTDALDASTLLAAIFGFLPADDERLRKSVDAIADDLTEDGFVLRYRTDQTDDGMSGKEGSFLICSFWLVSALAIVGEQQRARDLMEKLLRVASPLGLYAEEFDTSTGRHLGNFPQAFSHLALIEAAGRIIVAERLPEYT